MRRTGFVISLSVLATCAGPDVPGPSAPISPELSALPSDAAVSVVVDAEIVATVDAAPSLPSAPEVWLKGSTHVHARPSGDSTTSIPDVLRWYERRNYDFIVLSDHNRVSELDRAAPTPGAVTLRPPTDRGLIVFSGIELTHNPSNCIPAGDASGKCRIHVNLLAPHGRTSSEKIVWANRKTSERLAKYDAAIEVQKSLGGIAQLNHPNWFWGMNGDLLAELARRGFGLFEVANVAFAEWNAGDPDHPSLDVIWDAALVQGATIWGVASDDAHDYDDLEGATYPPGGGWIAVKAVREPQAILASIAAGRFYASTGVVLARAEVDGGELVVEVAAGEQGTYTIEWIENGKRAAQIQGRSARRPLPATGYLRAVVTRGDGKQAWVQPARR